MDGVGNIGGHIERDPVGDSVGKALADFFHCILDVFRYFHRVGSRQGADFKHSGIASVDTAFGIVGRGFERDPRHIPQTDQPAFGFGPDDDFFKFFHGRKAALGGDGNRDVQSFHRGLSQDPGGRFPVLIPDGILYVFDGQPEIG